MLLTISSRSLQYVKRAKQALQPMEIPDFAAEELGVKGINANTALLRGMGAKDLERLRDRADRARCPILVLVDEAALDFGPDAGPASIARIERLGMAASKLGAPAVAVELSALPAANFDAYAANIKRSLVALDRFWSCRRSAEDCRTYQEDRRIPNRKYADICTRGCFR
jgi:sugar phosphate isomerase/epimerase